MKLCKQLFILDIEQRPENSMVLGYAPTRMYIDISSSPVSGAILSNFTDICNDKQPM